jgi:hypothetical protein
VQGLLGVLSCHRAHLFSIGRGHVSSQLDIIIHCDEIYRMIFGNLSYKQILIIRHIKEDYHKAWIVKQKVLGRRFDTYEGSYDNLSQLIGTICSRDLVCYFHIKTVSSGSGHASII